MCPVASGHWRSEEGWGTFFSGLFSLWSQDLKDTQRITYFKAVRTRPRGKRGVEDTLTLSPDLVPSY